MSVSAALCAAVAALAVLVATQQPWLGVNLEATETGIRIASVDEGSPSAALQLADLLRIGDFAFEPRDIIPEADAVGDYPDVNRFYDRQGQIADRVSAGAPLTLKDADGAERQVTVQPAGHRPLGDLSVEFWVQIIAGVLAFIIGAWVWALKPSDWGARFFALSGAAMLMFTNSAAVYSTRELALDPVLYRTLALFNTLGACTFGVAMIGLFLVYPKRLVPLRWIGVLFAAAAVWWLLALFGKLGEAANGGVLLTLVEMLLILVAIGWQALANRKDPVGRAILQWLGLSVAVGAGTFVFLNSAPQVFGYEPVLNQGYAFGLFLLIYVGLALGLRRYRLFELGEWAFRILFYTGAALAFLGLDALLILSLGMAPTGAIGLSVLAVAFLYLPLRDILWRRMVARRRIADHELFQSVIETAFAGSAKGRGERWRSLVSRLFDPLEITTAASPPTDPVVSGDGLELTLPATADAPALVLRYPWKGRGLFGPVHLNLARELTRLMGHAEASRDAFEHGAARERGRIARDLHDDIGARLLSGLHKTDVEQSREVMREAIADMRIIVSGLTGASLPLSGVVAQLRHETLRRLEPAGITLDWPLNDDEADERTLAYPTYRNWSSAHREIVSNAIRHSGAKSLKVRLRRDGDGLVVTVEDDGRGIAGTSDGHGLYNISRRISELGGEVTYPATERGVTTRLVIPLATAEAEEAVEAV